MQIVTKEQIEDCLIRLGIQAGDGLLVHSAVQFLGHPEGGLGIYLEAIQNVIGKSGTLVVPTFNFSFAAGEPYDPAQTPSKGMGVFSEFIRLQPGAMRSQHPMQSIAAIGQFASDLTRRDTLSAFDPGSAFERMLELTLNCYCWAPTPEQYRCSITANNMRMFPTVIGRISPARCIPPPAGRLVPTECMCVIWKLNRISP